VRFAPFLLDPTTPPEGKPRRQHTQQGEGPTPIEQRAEGLGITFTRGRTLTSNSHLSLEAAEFAAERPEAWAFHRRMFKAYFEDLEDIGNIDTVVRIGEEAGLPAAELRAALESGQYRDQVDEALEWSRSIGVTAVPTFVFDERYGIVGAQDYMYFERVMKQLGCEPRGPRPQ
jgi:predicted DsbA family dithiol-disulfide isomerase